MDGWLGREISVADFLRRVLSPLRLIYRSGILFLLAGSFFFAGCVNPAPFSWREPTVHVVWPPPPEKPRIRYLASFDGVAGMRREEGASATILRWLLGKTSYELPFATPYSVAAVDEGLLWVADSGSRMLYRLDLVRGRVEYIRDFANAQLALPVGVVFDGDRQRVLISDSELGKVLVFDSDGSLLSQWAPPDGFGRPGGLALDRAGNVYVVDVVKRQVVIFSGEGVFGGRRGSRFNADGRFGRPVGVAIGPNDELLVLDAGNSRVEVQDSRGEPLRIIGGFGDAPGTFARPRGIAVSSDGLVAVSDAAFDNVQVFDMAGRLLIYFGVSGGDVGQFNLPAGLCFDREGRLFVADSYNHRVQVFEFLPGGSD